MWLKRPPCQARADADDNLAGTPCCSPAWKKLFGVKLLKVRFCSLFFSCCFHSNCVFPVVLVHVCACARARARVCVCVCVCVQTGPGSLTGRQGTRFVWRHVFDVGVFHPRARSNEARHSAASTFMANFWDRGESGDRSNGGGASPAWPLRC